MDNFNKVLTVCCEQAKKGADINVFDLMYETSLAYPQLKDILDNLVLKKELEAIDIKTYKFTGEIKRKFEEGAKKPCLQDAYDPLTARQAYLEERRQELIKRMLAEEETKSNDETDDAELRYKALKHCIERGQVSVSFLQRSFPINYIKACELVDWMENMGYVSAAEGIKPRKVLITLDEFNNIFNESGCEETLNYEPDEDDDELDKKFAQYEKFLRGETDVFDLPEDGKDCSEKRRQEGLVKFLKSILREGRLNKPWEEIPEHPSWDNENEFMRFCAEKLMEIVNSDKRIGRQGALKKAEVILKEVRRIQSKKMIEVYECIVFDLQNMSNYYYIKIREGLL